MTFSVWHYDGQVARRRTPRLVADATSFTLEDEWGSDGPIPWDSLVAYEPSGTDKVFGLKHRPGWRLGLADEIPPEVAAHLPHPERYGRWIDHYGVVRACLILAVIAGVSLFAILTAPSWIAPWIPSSWERRLGDAIVGDFGGKRFCEGPGGQAALDMLAHKLDPGAVGDIQVRVANIRLVNAVALPGGKIVIFRGLLDEASSADEVAGVLGHEIGHVRNRDVLAALLRQAGLSVLVGGMDGNLGGAFNALLSARYSREAEAAADDYSIGALRQGHVSTVATAAFFKRQAANEAILGRAGVALSYISSHPMSAARERLFATGTPKGASTTAVLSPDQWKALANICKNVPKAEEKDFFGF